jgi:hypothetical protein
MTHEEKEKLKDILAELTDQMYEISPGLPNGRLTAMFKDIEDL